MVKFKHHVIPSVRSKNRTVKNPHLYFRFKTHITVFKCYKIMERFVSNLWDTLNIVIGSRQLVFVRQRLYTLLEKNEKNWECNYIDCFEMRNSGSKAEGLNLPASDIDLMIVMKKIVVKPLHCENADFIMEAKNIKPGFVKLTLGNSRESIEKLKMFQSALSPVDNGKIYLSSLVFRDIVGNNYGFKKLEIGQAEPHGPCATYTLFKTECDNMYCLQSKEWPKEANEWVGRQRKNNWPSKQLVKEIVNNGFLLVPVGNPLSHESHMEWRISFSLAEKALLHSVNHTQFLCYGLLKLCLKHVIDAKDDCQGLLCSYFLKTALFYCIEEEDLIWEKANLLNCFWACFKRLLDWVRRGYCPNYFIQTNNMFESKIFGQSKHRLEAHLFSLYDSGTDTIMQIPSICDIFNEITTGKINATFIKNFHECQCDAQLLRFSYCGIVAEQHPVKSLLNDIEQIKRISVLQQHLPVDYLFYKMKLFRCHCFLIQYLYQKLLMKNDTTNSFQYKQFRQLSRYILRNCTSYDICTGLLMYATLHYLFGQYGKVVPILEDLLTKFRRSVLYIGPFNTNISLLEYIDEICGKGYSMKQKCNSAVAMPYRCIPECDFYPAEIQHEVKQHENKLLSLTPIPPKVYAYVLLFLTYHKIGNTEVRNQTLDKLCESEKDEQFIAVKERPLVSALLDVCVNIATSA